MSVSSVASSAIHGLQEGKRYRLTGAIVGKSLLKGATCGTRRILTCMLELAWVHR